MSTVPAQNESAPTPPDEPAECGVPLHTSAGPVQMGWFSRKEKVLRLFWRFVELTLFRCSFRRADNWRAFLLRRFGAKVGAGCLIRANIKVEVPWNITLGDGSSIGEGVILYSLGPITIGDRTTVSQYSHLCAGSHDHTRSDMPLYRVPIRIGSDVWVCADVFVGPGVVIGDGAMVGARATVVKDLPAWKVCVGNPARSIKDRRYRRVQ